MSVVSGSLPIVSGVLNVNKPAGPTSFDIVRLVRKGTGAKKAGARLYLYRGTWQNPHPDKRVVSIDYHSANDTAAAPFCVAITAESK